MNRCLQCFDHKEYLWTCESRFPCPIEMMCGRASHENVTSIHFCKNTIVCKIYAYLRRVCSEINSENDRPFCGIAHRFVQSDVSLLF